MITAKEAKELVNTYNALPKIIQQVSDFIRERASKGETHIYIAKEQYKLSNILKLKLVHSYVEFNNYALVDDLSEQNREKLFSTLKSKGFTIDSVKNKIRVEYLDSHGEIDVHSEILSLYSIEWSQS